MGIYLPTISCLIEESEIPVEIPESYHAIQHLLEKYWGSEYCYQCTTGGYEHLQEFSQLRDYFKLTEMTIFKGEVGFANLTALNKMRDCLYETENLFLTQTDVLNEYLIDQNNHSQAIYTPEYDNEKYKQIYIENKTRLKQLDLCEIYKQATLLKDISDFDLQDQFKESYHAIIAVAYWLKTQIHIVNKGLEIKKSFMYVLLSPL